MNRKDLIQAVVAKSDMPSKDVEKVLNSIIGCIGENLRKGESVVLIGFGTFAVKERAARTGINPTTKQQIAIPAKKVIKFKPGKALDIEPEK